MHPSRQPQPPSRRQSGFTLIELLVVITILGILAGIVVFAVQGIGDKGKASAGKADAAILRTAEEANCAQHGTYADMPGLLQNKLLASTSGLDDVSLGSGGVCGTGPGSSFSLYPAQTSVVVPSIALGLDNGAGAPGDTPNPTDIAVDPSTNKVYVANGGDNTVNVLDGTTNKVIDTIAVGGDPTALTVNPMNHKIYVFNDTPHTVSIIDGSNDQVLATPTVTTTGVSTQITIDPLNQNADVFSKTSTVFSVISGSSDAALSPLTLGSGNPAGVGYDPAEKQIYVATLGGMSFIDETTQPGTVTDKTIVNSTSRKRFSALPGPVAVNITTHTVYEPVNLTPTTPLNPGTVTAQCPQVNSEFDMYVWNGATDAMEADDQCFQTQATMTLTTFNPNTNQIFVTEGMKIPSLDGSIGFFQEDNSAASGGTGGTYTGQVTVPTLAPIENGGTNREFVVNPNSDRLYYPEANNPSFHDASYVGGVAVIDGTTRLPVSGSPFATGALPGDVYNNVVVNLVTNTIYAINTTTGTLAVIQ